MEYEDGTMTEVGREAAAHAEPFYQSPEFWVAIAFLAFVALLLYVKVPKLIASTLDKRSAAIATQIDEARRLREESEALLAQYQRKEREAHDEANQIVAHAETEAKRVAADAQKALEANIARREQLAVEKIAQAEATAVKEVRTVAVEVATEAARKVIAASIDPGKANALVEDAIRELPKHLH
ncbi:F0F1 ATP synthase subunit B [Emcibacter sp. SYSU 3D8]|uniref:F0F1 ATP synthase subunit B family protein n=1 Tax=Emcibacter sp. SYSU 3D8 TaxID=3133969 RepID=UPI0031FF3FF0